MFVCASACVYGAIFFFLSLHFVEMGIVHVTDMTTTWSREILDGIAPRASDENYLLIMVKLCAHTITASLTVALFRSRFIFTPFFNIQIKLNIPKNVKSQTVVKCNLHLLLFYKIVRYVQWSCGHNIECKKINR